MDIERGNDGWILTYTGRQVWPLHMRPLDFDLLDIAHALSMKCRFSGHTREFYSVAQHSVLAAENAWHVGVDAKVALLHDAAEAYLPDIATPLKHQLPETKAAEQAIQGLIFQRYCPEMQEWIDEGDVRADYHRIDEQLLRTEMRELMQNWSLSAYGDEPPHIHIEIDPWAPDVAESKFLCALHRFNIDESLEDYR